MNRVIDYRTDLYSLGATLYYLLSGQPPFQSDDPLELVHCHLSKLPVPPCDLTPWPPSLQGKGEQDSPLLVGEGSGERFSSSFPTREGGQGVRFLSAIILKLLAKNAEDRYQSAFGLKADLEWCLANLTGLQDLSGFIPGQHDHSGKFQIPQKLYGREPEIATLLQAFDRISQSTINNHQSEMLLVAGYSGIGKSALVHEVHKPITARRGYFSEGKFDQFQRNEPYSALIDAFQRLVRQLLTESDSQIAAWQKKLLTALGPNGQVIIEVIPEVALLIGAQPDVPELPPAQAQNRFNFAFQNFVRTFTAPEHPLVLFLDDLQWADSPSLQLLKLLMTGSQTHDLLIIGAYRDNEVNAAHPLLLTLKDMQQAGAAINTITMGTLALEDVTRLIAETLKTPPRKTVLPLAEICHQKTGGNPFFLTQFLTALHEEGYVTFNPQLLSWQYDVPAIQQAGITANVVELMTDRIHKLPETTQQVMQLAACIGNQFDVSTLAVVHEHSPTETFQAMWPALQEGLLVPLDDTYKYIGLTDHEGGQTPNTRHQTPNINFKFLHDRVQQAAYALIADDRKQIVHLAIGRLLLANTPETERDTRLFEIVDHLNAGKALLTDPSEKETVARLNLHAGQKAKASAAYEPAFRYVQTGIELLTATCWQQQYDLTLALHVETAETAFLSGDFEQMEHLTASVLQHARTLLDKVKAYEVKIQAYIAQNRLLDSIHTAYPVLKLLGVKFPRKPNLFHVVFELLQTKVALLGKPIKNLISLPEMTDPHKLAAMRILTKMSSAAYIALPKLLPLIGFKGVRLLLQYGNAPASPFIDAGYGLMLFGFAGDIESLHQFGEVGLRLLERLPAKEVEAQTIFVSGALIRHWKEHARETLSPLLEAYQCGLETGDIEFAAFAPWAYARHLFLLGRPLPEVERTIVSYENIVAQLKQETTLNLLRIDHQTVLNLIAPNENSSDLMPWCLIGKAYNEQLMIPLHRQTNHEIALFSLYCFKLFWCYHFQAYPQAVENADLAAPYIRSVVGMLIVPFFYFYDALTRLAVFPKVPKSKQKHYLKKVTANQKKMRKWAQHAPMNHLHKWQLVEAERARVLGKDAEAMALYDKAIAGAQANEYINEEALANEVAARFWLAKEKKDFALLYLRRAHQLYGIWGAKRKVQDLEERYTVLLAKPKAGSRRRSELQHTITDTTATDSGELDLTTVIKASQAMSSELDLNTLLNKLLQIMLENAGANVGKLLLPEAGAWVVKAEIASACACPHADRSQSLAMTMPFPAAIINYAARLKEPVILADASQDAQFSHDPYIQACRPLSVLCLPLIKQQQLVGLLYLENTLTIGVFTPSRLELLNLLASQAAIAIENARLYDTLEQRVAERTQALEQANQAKTAFLSKMSHDLRTPLNAILGYTQNLRREQSLTGQPAKDIAAIQRSGEQLLWLITDLLDLSRIELGKIELHPHPFPFPRFLQNLVKNFQSHAQKKSLLLTAELAPDLPAGVYADEGRLGEILRNLLSNALKFTPHGRVTLRVRSHRLSDAPQRNAEAFTTNIRFEIEDTGPGIPEEELPKIFLEFYQIPGTGAETQGTGLGLAISQQLVRLMGGELQVKSPAFPSLLVGGTEGGPGSTFWFDLALPVIEEYALDLDPRSMPRIVGYTGPCRRILVVDDREDNRAILHTPLTAIGFEVSEATNGREALNLLIKTHEAQQPLPAAILMDLRMPDMDGIEATRRIRALAGSAPLTNQRSLSEVEGAAASSMFPVILGVSASVSGDVREQCLAAGCQDFLGKPVDFDRLFECLRQQLGLEWIYAEAIELTPEQQPSADLPRQIPPHNTLATLLEFAQGGRITEIQQALTDLKAADPGFAPFADRIQHMVEDFQLARLVTYLQSLKDGKTVDRKLP